MLKLGFDEINIIIAYLSISEYYELSMVNKTYSKLLNADKKIWKYAVEKLIFKDIIFIHYNDTHITIDINDVNKKFGEKMTYALYRYYDALLNIHKLENQLRLLCKLIAKSEKTLRETYISHNTYHNTKTYLYQLQAEQFRLKLDMNRIIVKYYDIHIMELEYIICYFSIIQSYSVPIVEKDWVIINKKIDNMMSRSKKHGYICDVMFELFVKFPNMNISMQTINDCLSIKSNKRYKSCTGCGFGNSLIKSNNGKTSYIPFNMKYFGILFQKYMNDRNSLFFWSDYNYDWSIEWRRDTDGMLFIMT